MASFAARVKNELVHFETDDEGCIRAEVSALLRMGASFSLNREHQFGINFTTENAAVARRLLASLKKITAGEIKTELVVKRSRRLQKNNLYVIRAVPSAITTNLLSSIGFLQTDGFNLGKDSALLGRYCYKEAYLRGAFLGGGSVNRPDGGYHLELSTSNYEFSRQLLTLLRQFSFPAGYTGRKDCYVIYLKESDAIISFLRMIGADETMHEFESTRNIKDVRNQVNRLVNCETANLQKTVDASLRQVQAINKLIAAGRFDKLDKMLQKTAQVRLDNPDSNLNELAKLLKMSRSGVNHRLRKIEDLASKIPEEDLD